MSGVGKADLNQALAAAAKTILDAKGDKADLKKALSFGRVPRQQRALVDIFFKFIDQDWKSGAQVTANDVGRAVAFAKQHMVEKYDLKKNRLTKEELKQMALTGKRAVDLAKALKAVAAIGEEAD